MNNNNILTKVDTPVRLGNIVGSGNRTMIVGYYNDTVMVDGDTIYLSVYGKITAAIINGIKYLADDYDILRPTISAFFNYTYATETHKAIKEGKIHIVPFSRPRIMPSLEISTICAS